MLLASESLRETVGSHLSGRNVLDPDNFVLNCFPNEMMHGTLIEELVIEGDL